MSSSARGAEEQSTKSHLATESLRVTGALRLKVTGCSMLPTIWPGDTVVISRADYMEIVPGEIALFRRGDNFFVHRVLEKNNESRQILSRGDAMLEADPPFSSCELLGKIRSIVRNGKQIPPRKFSFACRVAAALMQRSETVSRLAVEVRQLYQDLRTSQRVDSLCQP